MILKSLVLGTTCQTSMQQLEFLKSKRLRKYENPTEACKKYFDELSKLAWIAVPKGDFDAVNPFLYYIRVLNGKRAELQAHMKGKGLIQVSIGKLDIALVFSMAAERELWK